MRLFSVAVVACSAGDPATIDVPTPHEHTGRVESTSVAHEDAPPPTLHELVQGGHHWRFVTSHGPVHVWIPRGYNARRAETVVYVHGFYTHVDDAWTNMRLDYQFASSTIDAMFVACEAPADGVEPVAWDSIGDLLTAVEKAIGQKPPHRRIVAVGHSGAWRTLVGWLDEPVLDTLVLLDAAYAELDEYKAWVLAADRHRLIDVGDDTRANTDQLHAQLPATVTLDSFPSVEDEIPKDAARAKILYIKSDLGHFPLVTGGIALPMVLRTLRAKKILDVPLAQLVDD